MDVMPLVRRTRLGLVVALLLLTLVVGVDNASGHAGHYPATWGAGQLPNIHYKMTPSVPDDTTKTRIDDAAGAWNAVQGAGLSFIRDTPGYSTNFNPYSCSDLSNDQNGIHFKSNLPTSIYAATPVCYRSNGHFKSFNLVLNSQLNWNSGTDDPASNEVDVWHVAAHEFGHAWGFDGHFDTASDCPPGSYANWQTMCDDVAALVSNDDEFGKKFRRTLEGNDTGHFSGAY